MTKDSVSLDDIRKEIKNSVDYVNKLSEKRVLIESVGKEILARVQIHIDKHVAALDVLQVDLPLKTVLNESVGILKKGIVDEGLLLSKTTGTVTGAIEGLNMALTIVDNLEKKVSDEVAAAIVKEEQQKALDVKIAAGIIDENTQRRPGTSPEGLKNIRKAKTRIKKANPSPKNKSEKSS